MFFVPVPPPTRPQVPAVGARDWSLIDHRPGRGI